MSQPKLFKVDQIAHRLKFEIERYNKKKHEIWCKPFKRQP